MKIALKHWRFLLLVVVGCIALIFILYIDRSGRVSAMIHSLGWFGVVIAILLMALLCMTPIPSEGLLLMYLNIYGVGWGLFLSWLGSTLSTAVIFVISRYFGNFMRLRATRHERFEQVDGWVRRSGSLGLLMARLLPVPAFVVNYAAGMVPSVSFWSYFWTGVLSILPYYFGAAMFYIGISSNWIWALIGVIPACVVGLLSYLVQHRKRQV